MKFRTSIACALVMGGFCFSAVAKTKPINIRAIDPKAAAKVSYTRDIKPILANSCEECHSPDERKSNFDVTTVESLKKKGKKDGPGVVPGKPDESAIVKYVRGLADGPQMPKGEPPLTEDELHLIRSWIAAGAIDDTGKVSNVAETKAAPKSTAVASNTPENQKILQSLLFDDLDAEKRLLLIRQMRLALLPPAPAVPKVQGPVLNPIDNFIVAKWGSAKLPEAKKAPAVCDDATFVRRVYLDLIGITPSAEEAQKFIQDKSAGKRAKLIDELLARTDDYAAHWTPFWEEALCSASADITGGIGNHGNHREWIYESFKANKPFDVFVAELIDPTMPHYRQPVVREANGKKVISAYIKNEEHMETLQSVANVAQVFLGTGMKCASCHSHFLNKEWPQTRFLGFAGMFSPHDLELIRCEKKSGQIIPAKFPFDLPDIPADVPQDYTNRLHRVAEMLVDPTNPRFAKTIVNRLWKRYLGIGLFAPIDDFRLDRPASHPELLDWLAGDFMRNGYDIKHTVRLILNSRTYQLAYNPVIEDHFNVEKPDEPRYFRSPALRRLTAEQIIDSIRASTTKKWSNVDRTYLDKTSTPLTRVLGRPPARNEVSTSRPEDVAVVQSLELLNGSDLYHFVYSGEALDDIATEHDFNKMVEKIYWLALDRAPTAKEQKLGVAYLKKSQPVDVSKGHEVAANPAREPVGDMLWALFVSPEFQFIR